MGKVILFLLLALGFLAYLAFREDKPGSAESSGEESGIAGIYATSIQHIPNPFIRDDVDRMVEQILGRPEFKLGDFVRIDWAAVDWDGNVKGNATTVCGFPYC